MLISIILLIATALALIYLGLKSLLAIRAISKWPEAQGTIVTSGFECVLQPSEGDGIYRPQLTYSYFVDGQLYKSSQLGINRSSFDYFNENDVCKFISQYSVGNPVAIQVDISDPSRCVLRPGASPPRRSHYYSLVASGMILLPITLALLYYYCS